MAFRDPFMLREELGTDDNDVIIGSLGNDTIIGFDGDDVLGGLTGRDFLDGEEGDDVVDGGIGDDVMIGGGGDDTIIASAGDDEVVGGSGSDHYVINGNAGDLVIITDTSGECDVMDARGAITSAIIDMNAGETSYVDGRQILLSAGEEVTLPVDLHLVQDLSGSFDDDIEIVNGLLPEFITAVGEIAEDVTFGASSFRDKPVGPFGGGDDFEYALDLPQSADGDDLIDTYAGYTASGGGDFEESQLSALLQVARRAEDIGWRVALNVAVLFTDADYHEAGDFSGVDPNNGDSVLDGDPEGSGEDYPAIIQVAEAMNEEGIDVVFAVTSEVRGTYNDLVAELGFGEVVTLSSDSSDLIEKVTRGVQRLTTTEIEGAIGGDFDDEIIGNDLDNKIRGRDGDDTIEGGNGDDFLKGNKGDDSVIGGSGNDTMEGGEGNDTMNGGNGSDEMTGNAGDDDMRGANGADNMSGGKGDDELRGGNGSDTLNGGEGDDLLDGQGKSDCFVFEGSFGDDTIDGYSASGTRGADDQMSIEGVFDLDDFFDNAVEVGDDVLFDNGVGTIRLLDVELSDISEADFKFDERDEIIIIDEPTVLV